MSKVKGATSLERAINKAMELGTVALKVDARTYTVAASNGRDEYTVTRPPSHPLGRSHPIG